jgi:hypothetical protein
MSIEVELAKLCRQGNPSGTLIATTVGDLCAQNNETLGEIVKDLELVRAQVVVNSPLGLRTLGVSPSSITHVVESLISLVNAVRSIPEDQR